MNKLDTILIALPLVVGGTWLWSTGHKPETNDSRYSKCVGDAVRELELEQHAIDSNRKSKVEKQYYYNNVSDAYINNLNTCRQAYQ